MAERFHSDGVCWEQRLPEKNVPPWRFVLLYSRTWYIVNAQSIYVGSIPYMFCILMYLPQHLLSWLSIINPGYFNKNQTWHPYSTSALPLHTTFHQLPVAFFKNTCLLLTPPRPPRYIIRIVQLCQTANCFCSSWVMSLWNRPPPGIDTNLFMWVSMARLWAPRTWRSYSLFTQNKRLFTWG